MCFANSTFDHSTHAYPNKRAGLKKKTHLRFILLILLFASCQHKSQHLPSSTNKIIAENKTYGNDAIYKVVQFIIQDQHLDRRLGFRALPIEISTHFIQERAIDTVDRDNSFVEIKDGKFKLRESATFYLKPRQCLTKEDIATMSDQLTALKDFRWDNTRLGFDTENKKEWYEFSVPLFSKDSSKVLMKMYWRCDQFLCGHDTAILLTKENGLWTSEADFIAVH